MFSVSITQTVIIVLMQHNWENSAVCKCNLWRQGWSFSSFHSCPSLLFLFCFFPPVILFPSLFSPSLHSFIFFSLFFLVFLIFHSIKVLPLLSFFSFFFIHFHSAHFLSNDLSSSTTVFSASFLLFYFCICQDTKLSRFPFPFKSSQINSRKLYNLNNNTISSILTYLIFEWRSYTTPSCSPPSPSLLSSISYAILFILGTE